MLTQHIGLVPEVEGMDFAELARVSAALQKQVARDVAPAWGVLATIDAFPSLDELPIGYWPVILSRGALGRQAGVHLDDNGQPYAQVQLAGRWSLAASRACVELLVNPYGTRTVSGQSLRADQGPVEFVLEVCGACEDARHAYAVNGVLVADFCLPAFFEPAASASRLTFGCAPATALRPLPGGHVSWYEPVADSYWLRSHWSENPIDTRLGAASAASLREMLNACAALCAPDEPRSSALLQASARSAQRATKVRADRLRALLGRRLEADRNTALTPSEPVPQPEQPRVELHRFEPELELAVDEPERASDELAPDELEPGELEPGEPEPDELEPDEAEPGEPEPDYAPVAAAELTEVTAPRAERALLLPPPAPPELSPPKPTPAKSSPPVRRPASIPSLAPIALPSVGAAAAPVGKRPWLAVLAGAAAIGLFWIAVRNDHAPNRSAARAPTAVASPAPTAVATPPVSPLRAPPMDRPGPSAQETPPAEQVVTAATPRREHSVRRRAGTSARALPPSPAAPAASSVPAVSTVKVTPAKIEDLIESRR